MNTVNVAISVEALNVLWATRANDSQDLSSLIMLNAKLCKRKPMSLPPAQHAPRIRTGKVAYEILGERRFANFAIDAYVDILRVLCSLEPGLPGRLAIAIAGRSRNYIGKTPSDVYPTRPDLWSQVMQIAPGWHTGTNIANRDKAKIIRHACELLGLSFGHDVVLAE